MSPEETTARVFRSIHLPHRRRNAENAIDGAPTDVQPGELIYDYEYNRLYAGLDDETTIQIVDGSAPFPGVTSDITGISGALSITNIVAISQANYDALPTKNPTTIYVIV